MRIRKTVVSLLVTAAGVAALAGCGGSGGGQSSAAAAKDSPYQGKVVYWYWAESDVPGANKWMAGRIKAYEALHPKVQIQLVPQSSDTLQGAFQTAAQSKSGPDIATQWATLPTLTPAWEGHAVPISDYVPASEIGNWLNTSENTDQGKVWAVPFYLLGEPFVWNKALFKKAGLDPSHGPRTWAELLADCAKLKAAGITPISMGNKDGAFGAWFAGVVGGQGLDSAKDLQDISLGKVRFSDPKYSGFLTLQAELKQKGYFNDDIASIPIEQGWQQFAQQKAAMSWSTDGNVAAWEKILGADKIGVQPTPTWGTGRLASYYDATQSSDAFITSWSSHKRAAAAFLAWLHQPENLESWYQSTGAFPADKRFPASRITDPLAKQLYALDTRPNQIWPENYFPPQVDSNGIRPAGQMILAGSGTPAQAVALWERTIKQWKIQQPVQYQKYQQWAAGTK
jgi:raffinose/stachyose/melibiose transport system substrate-binding protein